MNGQSAAGRVVPELALGTANWGATYGAPGREAEVDKATAAALAGMFLDAGHRLVDTATAYGRSEEIVGRVFAGSAARVVTKLAASSLPADARDAVRALVTRSIRLSGVPRLAGVLLHDSQAVVEQPAFTATVMAALRDTGLVDRVGVSVYTPEEALAAVEGLGADLVQLPCSLLDQRFVGLIDRLRSAGAEVHVRSILLNGLVLADPGELQPPVDALASAVEALRRAAAGTGCTPLRLAVGFARYAIGADAVVVGAHAPHQLREILDAWGAVPLADVDWASFAADDVAVDPRTWRE